MRWSTVVLVFVGITVVYLLFRPAAKVGFAPFDKTKARNDVTMLVTAANAYNKEYGRPPTGDKKSIVRTLQDENPRKIAFIELNPKEISKEGMFIDPWSSPYAFDLSTGKPWAYSFGKNSVDEGGRGDDVTSW